MPDLEAEISVSRVRYILESAERSVRSVSGGGWPEVSRRMKLRGSPAHAVGCALVRRAAALALTPPATPRADPEALLGDFLDSVGGRDAR
jgi:hypothetical protein